MVEYENFVHLYTLLAENEARSSIHMSKAADHDVSRIETHPSESRNRGPPPAPLSGNILDDPDLLWAEVIL